MRLMVSLLSLVLFFYLAGQLFPGVVMFEIGVCRFFPRPGITARRYWFMSYWLRPADILTDGVQAR